MNYSPFNFNDDGLVIKMPWEKNHHQSKYTLEWNNKAIGDCKPDLIEDNCYIITITYCYNKPTMLKLIEKLENKPDEVNRNNTKIVEISPVGNIIWQKKIEIGKLYWEIK